MRGLRVFLGAVAICGSAAAAQTIPPVTSSESPALRDLRIVPPNSSSISIAQEEANRRIVMQFHYEFFDLGHYRNAAEKYLTPDFRENDPEDPSGRENLVNFFINTQSKTAFLQKVIYNPAARPRIVSVLATGDMVMLVMDGAVPWPNGPTPQYHYISCDMFRLKQGKIAESWFSGTPVPPKLNK